MKILIVNEFYYPFHKGGAEISSQILAESLVRLGHDVVVCCSSSKNEVDFVNGVKVYYINVNPVYWGGEKKKHNLLRKMLWHLFDLCNLYAAFVLYKVFKNELPDVIHTNNLSHFSCVVWWIGKVLRIPICHTLRDYYLLCHKCTMYNHGKNCARQCLGCRFSSYVKRIFSCRVDAVVGISDFVLNRHIQYGFFEKSKLKKRIFNPVDTNGFMYDRKGNGNVLGFIGSLTPNKGVELLIESFKSIGNRGFYLYIAGDGPVAYVEKLKKLANQSANITFVGKQKPVDFFSKIGILVVPAEWHEPFGRTIIEAISYGVPVIASDRGGMPELLKDRSEGVLYEGAKTQSLTEVLTRYVNNEVNFCFDDVESFLDKFNSKLLASEYETVYSSIKKLKNK